MENKITEIIKTIFVAVVLTAGLAGAAFAQKPTIKDFEQAIKEYRKQSGQNPPKSLNGLTAKGVNASAVSQTNFNIGSELVLVNLYAMILDDNKDAPQKLILELTHLIDLLEGQPEAVALQKTLKTIVRKTSNSAQVGSEIENASNSYFSRLSNEQKWYFASGHTVMNLALSTYIGDDALIKKGLAEIQKLIKTAPPRTSLEILDPMNALANYVAKTTYSQNDYTAIFEGLVTVINSVNA